MRNTVEIVTLDELKSALETGKKLQGYLGYEPSGLFHIGWMIWALKVKDLIEAGVDFTLLEATWHAWINDKLGGNMELIREAAVYVRHALRALGIPTERLRFVDAEELVSDKSYWALLLRVAKNTTLKRAKRALTIMGRREDEAELDSSKIIYPFMQVTDIFYMDLDLALGGIDQRKAHMLARDLAEKMGRKKVIAIHTPLLTSLSGAGREEALKLPLDEQAVELKMSKSKPEGALLIHDGPDTIERKLRAAYCPPRQIELNPIIEINKYILFPQKGFRLLVERPEKYGGTVEFHEFDELARAYAEGRLHPADLKQATAAALAEVLSPVRKYFESVAEAREAALKIAAALGLRIDL